MEISDGNRDDTSLESPFGFSLSEPSVSEPPTRRYITRALLDKGKLNMRVLEKLQMKRKRIIILQQNPPYFLKSPITSPIQDLIAQPSIYEAPTPTPVTKSAPSQG